MSFGDLDKAIGALIKLAVYPIILVVVFSLVATILNDLPPGAVLVLLCLLLLLSPIAYVIREKLAGHPRRQGAPRGAERTPLIPPVQEEE